MPGSQAALGSGEGSFFYLFVLTLPKSKGPFLQDTLPNSCSNCSRDELHLACSDPQLQLALD